MILRLLINFVRWTWGLAPYDFLTMDKSDLGCLMAFGFIIDVAAVVILTALVLVPFAVRMLAGKVKKEGGAK